MTAKDHNETLVGIHVVIGSFFTLGLLASPWIIATNVRRSDEIPLAIIIFAFVLLVSVLMLSTAIAMWKKKPIGRKLAMFSASVLILICWPAGVYTWWFMHSDGARQMYGATED